MNAHGIEEVQLHGSRYFSENLMSCVIRTNYSYYDFQASLFPTCSPSTSVISKL